jgi:hypothetical protein
LHRAELLARLHVSLVTFQRSPPELTNLAK